MSKKLLKYNAFRNISESVTKRDNKKDVFNYSSIKDSLWSPIIIEAQKFQNINFDLENNDKIEQKTIFIDQLLRKDQPVKTEVNLALCEAGGDWEHPVLYFKIEFTHDHFISSNKVKPEEYIWDFKSDDRRKNNKNIGLETHGKYCLIPGKDINYLRKTEKGFTAYTEETITEDGLNSKDMKINKELYNKAWKWVEDLIHKLAEDRHKRLDDEVVDRTEAQNGNKISNVNESIIFNNLIKESDSYVTLDNGGSPFYIEYDDKRKQALIFKQEKTYDIKKLFNGKHKSKGDKGSSVLLLIDKHKYVFIGTEMFEFETEDEIWEFYSPIGNSAVPYPIAIGTENIYFLLEGKYIKVKDFEDNTNFFKDGYDLFYGINGKEEFKDKLTKHKFKNYNKIIKRVL